MSAFPDNESTRLTEKIMARVRAKYPNRDKYPNADLYPLTTAQYNAVYSAIYDELINRLDLRGEE